MNDFSLCKQKYLLYNITAIFIYKAVKYKIFPHNAQHLLKGQPRHLARKCAKEKKTREKLEDPQGNPCQLPPSFTY